MQPSTSSHWQIAPRLPQEAAQALAIFPPYLRQILYNRGIAGQAEAAAYLAGKCAINPDPMQLLGMKEAVERLGQAVERGEPVIVYGDYDADGVTATVLLVEVLRALGAKVEPYIPDRFEEGYGLNKDALARLQAEGARVVITVDCGIRSFAEAEYARGLGLDLIITDHHHPLERIPIAFAVVNPKQAGDLYPDKDLAGVGVAYKLAQALLDTHPVDGVKADDWLDLVAIGTVADMAPLVGENRALVRDGLRRLGDCRRQGLFSLAAVAGINLQTMAAGDIGFGLGPRLNAAGRMDTALLAYQVLTCEDPMEAGILAQQLDNQNRERRAVTLSIQKGAAESMDTRADSALIFALQADAEWAGVVGLAASKLVDAYYRPAVVGTEKDGFIVASCRSIPEIHITEALDQCADLLERHGGHAAAAGFKVRGDRLPELLERLESIITAQLGDLSQLRPTRHADIEIQLADLSFNMFETLARLEPVGMGNQKPVFVTRNARVVEAKTMGRDRSHLRLRVAESAGRSFTAVAFGRGHLCSSLPPRIDLMYNFEPNEYNGTVEPQLRVIDLKPAGMPD